MTPSFALLATNLPIAFPLSSLPPRHLLSSSQERDVLPLQSLHLLAPYPKEADLHRTSQGAVCADSHGLLLLGEAGIYCVRVLSWIDQLNTVVQVAY